MILVLLLRYDFLILAFKIVASYLGFVPTNKIKFDIKQEGFAWIADNKVEKKMIKLMKKGSRIMITGFNQEGSQTIDHYSLLGFTKAYGAAKKACG